MAECLTDKVINIDEFFCIYVKSETEKSRVIEILNNNGVDFPPPTIFIQEVWFNI